MAPRQARKNYLGCAGKKYENQPLPQKSKRLTKAAPQTSTPPVLSGQSASQEGHAEAVPCGSKRESEKSASNKQIDLIDLDSFLENCLKPPEVASRTVPQTPGCVQPNELDLCFGQAPPGQTEMKFPPSDLDWCFAPAPPSQANVCAPPPPIQGVAGRSLSGFDFDSFFDECLQSSTSCNAREVKNQANPIVTSHQNNPFEKHQQVLPAGKVEKQTNSPSLQHDPCKPCHQVEVPASSQSLNPQPSLTGPPGMKFDSDAFFDDFLGSTNGRHGTVSLKTSAVAW